jgi:hypothetical protein
VAAHGLYADLPEEQMFVSRAQNPPALGSRYAALATGIKRPYSEAEHLYPVPKL